MNESEFDQAVTRAAKGLEAKYPKLFGGSYAMSHEVARVALLAALQPDPCQQCEGTGRVFSVTKALIVHRVSTGQANEAVCPECGGSGRSNLPPALVRAVLEQVPNAYINDLGSFGPATMADAEPVYRYRGLSDTTHGETP